MRIHFIAIGGSAMHNLALAMHDKGYHVTGSDDEVFEPSKGRLKQAGILPEAFGWYPEKITEDIDAVILGMHARADNPELLKAQELGLSVYSYPEFIYNQSVDKKRVVIAGSHGKTTITSMILHVLNYYNLDFDYMVGAQLEGFDRMVKLTKQAPIIILEGDEYLSSPIDRRPKFIWYKPQIALISGIAWDHINVFPTFENYVSQFSDFVKTIEPNGALVYFEGDSEIKNIVGGISGGVQTFGYDTPEHEVAGGKTSLLVDGNKVDLNVFGIHNLQNMNGARLVLNQLDITDEMFYEAIANFGGAAKRLETIAENENTVIYKDFAHSPSKLKATSSAVKAQWPERELVAVMELHTFSSFNPEFLKEYRGSFDTPDYAVLFYLPETAKHKKLPELTIPQVKEAFGKEDLIIINTTEKLKEYLEATNWKNKNLLFMSSGNYGGIHVDSYAQELI
ncbi:peptidoglycan synthetase [bacterium SCSIO 12643]|nr:peptidoglycan synthetase [bacterium SCSIO 12643]